MTRFIPGRREGLLLLIVFVFFDYCCSGPRSGAARQGYAPCRETQPAAEQATLFSKTNSCKAALTAIAIAAADGREHALSFGRDPRGTIIRSAVSNGTSNSTIAPAISNRFADLHNHPENRPPSSGDLYHFIDQATATSGTYQKFILLPDGTVYALVLACLQDAADFNKHFPRRAGIHDTAAGRRYQPTFPGTLTEEINQLKGWGGASEEAALAFILQKYKAGIALLKKNPDGHFRRIYTIEQLQKDGTRSYQTRSCPD
ncbi:hypothetical protein [Niabella beijingensis]|uniref:hypothetical protein n=1 Tax=Niabella beijingensis TaxID=2872700 RepID=UPI001CBED474|nr:hypothetical protein [Niabella beijingensis]MBZ4190697.1 hypothetical protein [Niabella beijingensis]